MGERDDTCAIGDEARFLSLSGSARPFTRSQALAFLGALNAVRARAAAEDAICARRAQFEVWRLIHEWTRRHPFRDRAAAVRSRQWRDALEHLRDLGEPELTNWLALQVEVAVNREAGRPDMRPRDPGPTWLVALRHVANRKQMALAVLRWAEAAEREGCANAPPDRQPRAAARSGDEAFGPGCGDHEGVPFVVDRSA